ncbi:MULTISPECIES: response regulator [Flavobacterium]|uniref:response regulator n=1 Tax=Flavobacterium TaxID=237 RepID=UPI00211449F4|nr:MULTISPECIES: response regulator [Flavobacterium]UUF12416.1 response regulator [Flavobacterium panici]
MIENTQKKFDTVMIIDDNAIDLYITSRMVLKNNFAANVLNYESSQEALQFIHDNQNAISKLPQVIFLDIYMPIISGFQFLEAFHILPDAVKNYCKVYIISSTIDNADIAESNSNKDVVSFHSKPITKEFLDRIT